jgi:hypothetical protein
MKDIPGQRKIPYTYHSSVLGYPIPGFRDIPKISKDIPGISSTCQWSYPWPIPEIS